MKIKTLIFSLADFSFFAFLLLICVVFLLEGTGRASDPANLREALLSHEWSLDCPNASWGHWIKGHFFPDGSATISVLKNDGRIIDGQWTWKILGPRALQLQHNVAANKTFTNVFLFNDALNAFATKGDWPGANGHSNEQKVTEPPVASKFENELLRNRWTWPGKGGTSEPMYFQQGGIVVDPGHWTGHWEIKDANTRAVVITAPFDSGSIGEVVLTFDQGFTKWNAPNVGGFKMEGLADGSNCVELLASAFLDVTDIILGPLGNPPPADLRNQIVRLNEGLKDEETNAPQADPGAYASGEKLCDMLVLALEQREAFIRRLTGGPLIPNSVPDSWAKSWQEGGVGMRRTIEAQYGKFRDKVRASSPSK
jgi:hypothetical protein